MEFLSNGFQLLFGTLLPFLAVLTVVVFFHELGHFLVARWNGVGVAKFAVGFGPDLWSTYDKHGTKWALSAIPLGGYVKFIDDGNEASMPADADALEKQGHDPHKFFARKKLWQRAAVVAAGPIANFILAIVIFAGLFWVNGREMISPRVESVIEGSVAERSGFQVGDVITAVNGDKIESFTQLQRIVTASPDTNLVFEVNRNGGTLNITATPERVEVDDGFGGKMRVGRIGISRTNDPESVVLKQYGPLEAIAAGTYETYFVGKRTIQYITGLITGYESIDQVGGPIRIAEVSGQVFAISIAALISLTAVLSVSIGIMNLLPIPVLDGGHLVFYAIEAVRGKPLSEKAQQVGFKIGLAFVLTMMVVVTTIDINRLIDRFL